MGSLFGTDGVRGLVGVEPISPQTMMKLGWAVGSVLGEKDEAKKVLIGKDTRISGYLLESALEAGFAAAGVNVSLLGPIPTPAIAYLTRTARATAGVVISASHNPFHDNGVKIFSAEGTKLDEELIAKIDEKMQQPMECVSSAHIGKAERFTDAQGRYIEYCKSTFAEDLNLRGLNVVIDCANGAAYDVGPKILDELGANLHTLSVEPDGLNINADCGSTHMQALCRTVIEKNADIGIALDGDADRVLLVDENGFVVDGDQILFIIARHRARNKTLNGGVVGTLMTNLGLQRALEQMHIPFVRTKVGDRYVHAALEQQHWQLGGETSGHIICLDKSTTGDGMVAALEVLQIMLLENKSLSALIEDMEVYPQTMLNVETRGANAQSIVVDPLVVSAVAEAEEILNGAGRVVLRPSGTEPLIRVMIEGNNPEQVKLLTKNIATVVEMLTTQ